ncbi:hypothetical protein FOA52_013226 [Chlamydomonas sp. UWO 241]|nr:hypothetical protein FOA52_013226 [Chlamydomonas sp. UWO 241]
MASMHASMQAPMQYAAFGLGAGAAAPASPAGGTSWSAPPGCLPLPAGQLPPALADALAHQHRCLLALSALDDEDF